MAARPPINPNHAALQGFFRMAGPLLLIAGGLFMIVGVVDFFSSFGGMHPPQLFWCCFVGMPLLAGGIFLTKLGYLGKMARYLSQEVTPVATDTFNYAAGETREGVRQIATAISEGLSGRAPATAEAVTCPECTAANDADARFCSQCGTALPHRGACPGCGHEHDSDARFCDNCGRALRA